MIDATTTIIYLSSLAMVGLLGSLFTEWVYKKF